MTTKAATEATFLGHKGRSFDVRLSSDSTHFLSASEDGTTKLWNRKGRKCIHTLRHNIEAEVLRSTFLGDDNFCTGGSDGKVVVWKSDTASNTVNKSATMSHMNEESQIYACEPLNTDSNCRQLITAADNHLHLWDVSQCSSSSDNSLGSAAVRSWDFTALPDSEDSFGGPRNADNDVYVFDAKASPSIEGTVAVALSDATIRLLDIREPPETAAYGSLSLASAAHSQFAGENFGHATSVSWSSDSSTILVSLGSGKVAVLDTRMGTIRALLVGHAKACFGAAFVEDESKCISWSSDTTIRAWDVSTASGICRIPISEVSIKDFPILSCTIVPDVDISNNNSGNSDSSGSSGSSNCGSGNGGKGSILCGGGGGSANTFMGTPLYQVKPFW